ncbi:MAG: glycosyltransferase 87 family protein [Actinomycetota bacterium]|nr:glycosyltransferase 87 family protein [Actinomycetota bacterium]
MRSSVQNRALLALMLSVLVFCVLRALIPHRALGDLRVYRAEGMAMRNNMNLYAHLAGVHGAATYPTFAALIFVILTPFPIAPLQVLSIVSNLLILLYVCRASCHLVGIHGRQALVPSCVLAAGALWSEPVFTTFAYGQINLVLLALIIWDFTLAQDSRLRGVGTGLAAAMKVTPAILILYLLITRRFRAAVTAGCTFGASLVVSAVANPQGTWSYWTKYLFDLHRTGRLENAVNQSVRGMLVRVDHTRHTGPTELGLVLVVLVLGFICAWAAYRTLGEEWGLPACAVTGLLVSPISWSHHWVWCIPIAALLWFRARAWLFPTVAIFSSYVVLAVPHVRPKDLHFTTVQIALSGWYVLFGLGFLALTAWRVLCAQRNATTANLALLI